MSGEDEERVRRYLSYAEELKMLSERMLNTEAKALVLSVAADYVRMADTLEAQLDQKQKLEKRS